jgi:hypothetical protein
LPKDAMLGWWFETDRFTEEHEAERRGEEPDANPGRYGRQLAEWLAGELRARSWDIGDVFCEDWGWMVSVGRDGCRLYVACGNEDGSTERWHLGPEASPSLMQRLMGKPNASALVQSLDADIETLLRADDRVKWLGRGQRGGDV